MDWESFYHRHPDLTEKIFGSSAIEATGKVGNSDHKRRTEILEVLLITHACRLNAMNRIHDLFKVRENLERLSLKELRQESDKHRDEYNRIRTERLPGQKRALIDYIKTDLLPLAHAAPIDSKPFGIFPESVALQSRLVTLENGQPKPYRIGATRATPLSFRYWYAFAMGIPLAKRKEGVQRGYHYQPLWVSLRELYRLAGWSRFRRHIHVKAINEALDQAAKLLLDQSLFQVVNIGQYAREESDLDEPSILIEVKLPVGNPYGARVSRELFAEYGPRSYITWSLYLYLCNVWNRYITYNGKTSRPEIPKVSRDAQGYLLDSKDRIITERGIPVTSYRHRKAIHIGGTERNPQMDRLPILCASDLTKPFDWWPGTQSKQASHLHRKRIDTSLEKLESDKVAIIEKVNGRFRFLPGPRHFDFS